MDALGRVLAVSPPETSTVRAWWDATAAERGAFATTVDRALVGGALADRVAFAFAGGYWEALRFLVPSLSGITALCATEEGGNHPRAIKTTLRDGVINGHKKWATSAGDASALLVVASVGESEGKNRLRVVRVSTSAPGVTIKSSAAPFVPEIEHAEVLLDNVAVSEADVMPGDGYDDYLKPFRTVEDLHVHAAVAGYLIGVARRKKLGASLVESLLAVAAATRALATADMKAASTHLALAGTLELVTHIVAQVEAAWSAAPDDEWKRWQRDRSLMQVATKARVARRETARTALL